MAPGPLLGIVFLTHFSQLNLMLSLSDCATCQYHHHFLILGKLLEIFSTKVSVSTNDGMCIFKYHFLEMTLNLFFWFGFNNYSYLCLSWLFLYWLSVQRIFKHNPNIFGWIISLTNRSIYLCIDVYLCIFVILFSHASHITSILFIKGVN